MLWFDYLSAIIDPFVLDATMEKVMLNYDLSVCDNDSMSMMTKSFGNVPLKDLTMERKRVKEFEESLCEDCG